MKLLYIIKLEYGKIGALNIIVTEIPVWKKYYNKYEFITGHIDFLFEFNNKLIIADLKPQGKSEILKSMPQLLAYAIMLKDRLKELNKNQDLNFEILCLGFSKKSAWIFKPDKVGNEILTFMNKTSVKSSVIKITKDLIS